MYCIIANQLSGGGQGERAIRIVTEILDSRKVPYELRCTEYQYHAISLAELFCSQKDCTGLIVIGGDGTLSEVVNGMNMSIPLGLIPAGTGNDFAATAALPDDPAQALELILSAEPKPIDYIQVGSRRAINVTGTGFDVGTLQRFEAHRQRGHNGKIWYYFSLIATLIANERYDVHAVIDDTIEINSTLFLLAAANGRFFGGGMPVSPLSEISDGMMDIVLVRRVPPLLIPRVLLHFLKGRLSDEPKYASVYRGRKLEVSVSPHLYMQRDGEVVDELPARFELIPGGLRMFI